MIVAAGSAPHPADINRGSACHILVSNEIKGKDSSSRQGTCRVLTACSEQFRGRGNEFLWRRRRRSFLLLDCKAAQFRGPYECIPVSDRLTVSKGFDRRLSPAEFESLCLLLVFSLLSTSCMNTQLSSRKVQCVLPINVEIEMEIGARSRGDS